MLGEFKSSFKSNSKKFKKRQKVKLRLKVYYLKVCYNKWHTCESINPIFFLREPPKPWKCLVQWHIPCTLSMCYSCIQQPKIQLYEIDTSLQMLRRNRNLFLALIINGRLQTCYQNDQRKNAVIFSNVLSTSLFLLS